MSEYKRFTERDEFGNADIIGIDGCDLGGDLNFKDLNRLTNALNRFAELEDKIESGKLVELPCKVGDTVYCLISTGRFGTLLTSGKVFERKVTKIVYDGKRFEVYSERPTFNDNTYEGCNFSGYVGETVFTNKSQAEARLKELRGGVMFYFKFTDKNGDQMYGKINADKEQISIDKLKNIIGAVTLEEVTKAEYDAQDEEE